MPTDPSLAERIDRLDRLLAIRELQRVARKRGMGALAIRVAEIEKRVENIEARARKEHG